MLVIYSYDILQKRKMSQLFASTEEAIRIILPDASKQDIEKYTHQLDDVDDYDPEQDIFLMAQLKAINGGEITASRRLRKKTRTNKRTFYY